MSGWSNYSGMVTAHKIYESIMDNRVSKSELLNNFVKEQRVYGSYHLFIINYERWLRYTLMALERGYHIKIPSKLSINNVNNSNMDPWFITGLVDSEGCFSIKVGARQQL